MNYNLLWIFLLILHAFTASLPVQSQFESSISGIDPEPTVKARNVTNYDASAKPLNEQVISVRITSSVAVGRGRGKSTHKPPALAQDYDFKQSIGKISTGSTQSTLVSTTEDHTQMSSTDIPANLIGANIEYIKQINAKKESKEHTTESVHAFQFNIKNQQYNDNDPLYEESSDRLDEYDDELKYIPLARKIPSAADANQIQEHKMNKSLSNSGYTSPTNYNTQNHSSKISDFLNDSINREPSTTDYEISMKNESNPTVKPNIEQHTERRDINKLTPDGTNLLNNNYQSDDSIAESSIKSVEFSKTEEGIGNVPQVGTVPLLGPSQNYVHGLTRRPSNDRRGHSKFTTVSFNIVHDAPNMPSDNNEYSNSYPSQGQDIASQQHFYDTPNIYSQPAQIYSEPAKFYSEPSKVYSEPAKIYSEPAKVYSEPAKIYSEPAKIYSEPSKFYSQPASLYLDHNVRPSALPNYSPWQELTEKPTTGTTVTTPHTIETSHQPEKNYEVDEKVSILTNGRTHGVQETTTEKCKQDNCKVGYVVEGRQFKKYRVEERTSDGFIVGEYGVVRNEDGALRGVRYTADSDASPRLIHDALMKFLQL